MDYFEAVSANLEILIVLLLARPGKWRREEYFSFFEMVASSRLSKHHVLRRYRAFDQFILHILSSDLFFIHAGRGQLLPIFANMALACDSRIVSDNAVFQSPSLQLGLSPKGGNAFFMNRILGRTRTYRWLLAEKEIPATSLRLAKRLSKYFVKDLPDYLELENSELIKALVRKKILA